MIPAVLATDTIVRVRPAMINDHGTSVPDWDAPPRKPDLPISGCSVQPGAATEDLANRTAVTIRWTAFAPPGSDVTEHDGVRWQGQLYQVDARPQRFHQDLGGLAHDVIALIDWEG